MSGPFRSRPPAGRPGLRGVRRPARPAPAAPAKPREDDAFRVLIAVHRPRYRSRSERAVKVAGWQVRSLLNKEDPVGLINQQPPHLLIISDDFGRQKSLGIVKAVQRFRAAGLKVIVLFEDEGEAPENAELYDAALFPPWKAMQLRQKVIELFPARAADLTAAAGEEDEE